MIPIDPAATRRVLIRANNWIGDVVMISPAVRALRERFPEARLAMVAKRWVLEALGGNPYFDELIEYDRDGRHAGVSGRLRLAGELRRGGPIDLAVLFQKAFDAAAIAWLAGARVRVGYSTDRRGALLTHAVPLPPAGTHHGEAFLRLARALGCEVSDPSPFFHLTETDRDRATARMASAGVSDAPVRVALHPGASKPPRSWHTERFAALARRLHEQSRARFLLIGGPEDSLALATLAAALPAGAVYQAEPATGLRGTAALLERCHLFVGNDSGPMHLAAALRVPTVGIFGPGVPRTTAPIGLPGRVATLCREYPCAPCRQNFFRECSPAPSGKPFCLEEIGVDEVEQAAIRLLESPRAGTNL